MSEEPATPPRMSVALTGKMLQFNITVGFLLLALVSALWICSSSENPMLRYGGTAISILGLVAVVVFAIFFHNKQTLRPIDGNPASISLKDTDGRTLTVQNPPDKFLDPIQVRALLRCFVGYDRDLCPDGELQGKASEPNYRPLSEEEKTNFKIDHEEKIRGKITIAEELLASSEVHDLPSSPDDLQDMANPV